VALGGAREWSGDLPFDGRLVSYATFLNPKAAEEFATVHRKRCAKLESVPPLLWVVYCREAFEYLCRFE
jgi:hypothetical protein